MKLKNFHQYITSHGTSFEFPNENPKQLIIIIGISIKISEMPEKEALPHENDHHIFIFEARLCFAITTGHINTFTYYSYTNHSNTIGVGDINRMGKSNGAVFENKFQCDNAVMCN